MCCKVRTVVSYGVVPRKRRVDILLFLPSSDRWRLPVPYNSTHETVQVQDQTSPYHCYYITLPLHPTPIVCVAPTPLTPATTISLLSHRHRRTKKVLTSTCTRTLPTLNYAHSISPSPSTPLLLSNPRRIQAGPHSARLLQVVPAAQKRRGLYFCSFKGHRPPTVLDPVHY